MSLEQLSAERPRAPVKLSFIVLGVWILWLCLISTLSLRSWVSIPCTSLVIVFGVFYWSVFEGLFIFLLMGFIYRGFSITPPALFWVALTFVFLIFKFLMFRLSVRTVPQLLVAIFAGALALDIIQWILLRMVVEVPVFSWSTLGGIIVSAFLQTILGIIFARPLLGLVAHK